MAAACLPAIGVGGVVAQESPPATVTLTARVIATGLADAQGLQQVGRFHAGGPLASNPEFLLRTQPGRVLDPERVLVAVGNNLGATRAESGQAAGAVLSIDPRVARPVVVAADAARLPDADGAPVQVYSAQSQAFTNAHHNAGAATARFGAVAGPRYLSINNAFGRPWIANAPFGLAGDGSESVLDPDGAPLANAPSAVAGGVFVGALTPRRSVPTAVRSDWFGNWWNRRASGQLTPGAIEHGAFGTALLGASPDGSGFAVFAVVTGSGAIVQVHVQDGVDGLAPAGTIAIGGQDPGVVGVAFNWSPTRALYVADARRDRLVVLELADDTRHFTLAHTRALVSPWLRRPVDIAAAVPEIANPRFSSHTTLAGGADLYVANRGDGSVLRMAQDGRVLARATIELPGGDRVGADRLRSLAVSADAQRLWLIVQARAGNDAALVEIPAFDAAGGFESRAMREVETPRSGDLAAKGARLFATAFTVQSGLGPLFNADSCLACHPGPGGSSALERHFARRVARMDPSSGRLLLMDGATSVVAPRLSTRDLGVRDAPPAGVARAANIVSLRMPLGLFGAARLDEIPDAVIEAQAVAKGDGIKGRVNHALGSDGVVRVGRYGWKADVVTLEQMVATALGNEMGLTSALAAGPAALAKDDGTLARALAAYVATLAPPVPLAVSTASRSSKGRE
ncbi:MAG: hypothetical protein ABJD97_04040 [Betaproteobacteria bacterium]